jgi:hypothetical protein
MGSSILACLEYPVPARPHLVVAAVAACCAAALPVSGHDLERTLVTLTFQYDGSFVLDVTNDPAWLLLRLESFAGGQVPAGLSPEARDRRLRELSDVFIDRVVLFVDGREIRPQSAEYMPPTAPPTASAPVPLATFRLRGAMPPDARTLRWLYGLVIDPYPLTIVRADGQSLTEWIEGSNWSGTIDLSGQFRQPTTIAVMRTYLTLGYTHILPKGLDHILFVLGLFLLRVQLRPILLQVTAFTVAHSLTLGLSMYGVLALPPRIVEPLIALSIAYVAIENLFSHALRPWRLALVFTFGLLHGMGFAGVLTGLGLPRGGFLTALLAFNLGVEAGQLTVIAIAALALAWYRDKTWYHRGVVVPVSLVIAAIGVYWTVTRVTS